MKKNKFECKRDGLTIRGIEYKSEGNNLPIAIISHGFMANYFFQTGICGILFRL